MPEVTGQSFSVDVSDIFIFFFCSGEGKGESEFAGGGGGSRFLLKNARRGGGYMREMGAICQIGVLTWKPCTFWVQNGSIFGLFALRF